MAQDHPAPSVFETCPSGLKLRPTEFIVVACAAVVQRYRSRMEMS